MPAQYNYNLIFTLSSLVYDLLLILLFPQTMYHTCSSPTLIEYPLQYRSGLSSITLNQQIQIPHCMTICDMPTTGAIHWWLLIGPRVQFSLAIVFLGEVYNSSSCENQLFWATCQSCDLSSPSTTPINSSFYNEQNKVPPGSGILKSTFSWSMVIESQVEWDTVVLYGYRVDSKQQAVVSSGREHVFVGKNTPPL